MKLVAWGKTDTGRKRDHNEDNYLIDADLELFAVADGMGGHQGGETASRMALEVVRREIARAEGNFERAVERYRAAESKKTQPISAVALRRTEELEVIDPDATPAAGESKTARMLQIGPPAAAVMMAAAREAGHSIFDAAMVDSELRGMGTTLTAMLHEDGRMHLVHAGDSRAFLFRDGKLEQLTEDHSWIAEQIKAGTMTEEEAKESKFRHIITRSVGFERDVDVDLVGITVEAGDCFLMCSDGMSNYVENHELEQILATHWYRRAPQLLIDLANERGGDDNITVVVVYVCNDAGE